MLTLTKALAAWGSSDFDVILKQEIRQLDPKELPLQQGLSTGSYALDGKLDAMILRVSDETGYIHAKVGIFYSGIIAGCSCADDPTPINEENEYCEIQIDIDKATAEARITLLTD